MIDRDEYTYIYKRPNFILLYVIDTGFNPIFDIRIHRSLIFQQQQ